MIVKIDIKDSVADKILYFLENFKNDVKIIKMEDIKKSEKDMELGNLTEINNVSNPRDEVR